MTRYEPAPLSAYDDVLDNYQWIVFAEMYTKGLTKAVVRKDTMQAAANLYNRTGLETTRLENGDIYIEIVPLTDEVGGVVYEAVHA